MGICTDDFMGMNDPIAAYLPKAFIFLWGHQDNIGKY